MKNIKFEINETSKVIKIVSTNAISIPDSAKYFIRQYEMKGYTFYFVLKGVK